MADETRTMSKKSVIFTLVVVGILLLIWIELAVGLFGTPWAGTRRSDWLPRVKVTG